MKTITQINELLTTRQASSAEITAEYLAATKRDNPTLGAFITVTEDTALAAAAAVDAKIAAGETISPLAGVPFVLKDSISTDGIATTCGSKMLENYVPFFDATVWSALKNAGAVLIGKGNMDEFAMGNTNETSYFGGARNPVDTAHVAGGSSGGVAAAVAGGLSAYGIGSDTGGSIRQPASFCGIVGLKPTYGSISRYGGVSYASSFDQIGPITLTVRDAATVFDAICAPDTDRDMTARGSEPISGKLTGDVRGLRIGIAREFYENLPADIAKALEETAKTYEKLGATLVDVSFPELKHALPAYYILSCAEASSNLGRFDGLRFGYRTENATSLDAFISKTRREGFGPEVRRRLLLGTYVLSAGYYDAYYNKALLLRRGIINAFAKLFEDVDVLLTPTAPVTAPVFGSNLSPVESYQLDICTVSVNIAGAPAISIPCGFDGNGLPIGAQLIGAKWSEATILNAALAYETEMNGKEI